MKKFLKTLLIIVVIFAVLFAGLLVWLTITEFRPDPVEEAQSSFVLGGEHIETEKEINLLSWNIGYGGLGKGSDFFMDGGKEVQAADQETVSSYLTGIREYIKNADADIVMLQEVDRDSKRTYGIDEASDIARDNSAFAFNYSCRFVPYPLPPIGRVNSGLLTTTDLAIERADRIALPCPFSWPVRTANLKRCLLASYMPVEGSSKYLVLVNLHLEAYDDGEGKAAQTKMLREFIEEEYEKGNYVIAGGDFNQTFPGSLDKYPITETENWVPPVLETSVLPEGWNFAYDESVPTCRLLNKPYDVADKDGKNQHYILDGFIISPNVKLVKAENADLHFENSDHNPVNLTVKLMK